MINPSKLLMPEENYSTTIIVLSERGSGRRRATVRLPYQLADFGETRFAVFQTQFIVLSLDAVEEKFARCRQRANFHPRKP